MTENDRKELILELSVADAEFKLSDYRAERAKYQRDGKFAELKTHAYTAFRKRRTLEIQIAEHDLAILKQGIQ